MNKLLIIEDDEGKAKEIENFISSEYPLVEIQIARSFRSGLQALVSGKDELELILLDMSMPSFDISLNEPGGGTPESFAGRELLAQMRLRSIKIPTIVVTMYDSFGEAPRKISLEQLVRTLNKDFSPPFVGLVYYNTQQEGWRAALKNLIEAATGN